MTTKIHSTWLALSSVAAWALGVGAGALNFDVRLDFDDDMIDRINVYMVAATSIVFGLMTIATSRLRRHRKRRAWTTLAVFGLVFATILFPVYLDRRSEWSCVYAGRIRIAVGATLTRTAAAHVQNTGRTLSPCMIAEDFAGDLNAVWPRNERELRHQLLAGLSYGAALSLAIAVFSIAQAVGRDWAQLAHAQQTPGAS